MIEICRSIFKSFNVNNLSVYIGWCADQVTSLNMFLSFVLIESALPSPVATATTFTVCV